MSTTSNISNNTIITLSVSDESFLSFVCPRAYNQNATILISTPGMTQNSRYSMYNGSTEFANGTFTNKVNGSSNGQGGGPGGPGR